jgi:DNA-binding NarL/FixJ family response regulator
LMVDRDCSTTDGSRAILEAAALLNQPFSVPLLIDLGFSADTLDPLSDSGIFREPFPNRAEFTNSGLRNELLAGMPWSRKRRLCEQVGELLSHQLRANNVVTLQFLVLWVSGVMADFEGNHALATEQYRELFSLWHETEDRMMAVPGVVSAAGFYADRRDSANLAACCEILNVIAQENQNEETRAASRGVLAETAWYHGDQTNAVALMRDAVEGYDRVGTTLEMAFLRRRFALMLATLGQPREAEERRREASELARRLGLRPFLDLLQRDTIAAASLRSESPSRPGTATGLTPRQHSILGLIAKGLTNKEIASHLNLSARTIEMHVALALERLNCRTRSEAVSRAMSLGLMGLKD